MNEFVTVSESRTVTAHGIFNNNWNSKTESKEIILFDDSEEDGSKFIGW